MKPILFPCVVAVTLGVSGCDVDQTQEGKMPDVDVQVEGGQLPEYDVKTADVDVGTTEKTVKVPDVDVEMEEKEITVPTVYVTMPDDEDEANKQN